MGVVAAWSAYTRLAIPAMVAIAGPRARYNGVPVLDPKDADAVVRVHDDELRLSHGDSRLNQHVPVGSQRCQGA
jgi:hypothetical protein